LFFQFLNAFNLYLYMHYVPTIPSYLFRIISLLQMVSETFDVPGAMVGKLIGKGGETIRNLQLSTDTRIQVDHTGEGPNKRITISGYTQDHVQRAKDAVMALDVEEAQRIVECPPNLVGRIIGRGGETIRALQSASEAHITVNQDFPPDQNRQVVIQGGDQSIERAVLMVNELIHGEPGSAQAVIQRICQAHGIGKSEVMTAPKMIIGRIIGRGGETIKQIQKTSGATVQIEQSGDPCKLSLAGQPAAVEQAKAFITEIMNGGDPFGTGMMGGPPGGGGYGGGGGGYGGGYGGAPGGGYGGYPPQAAGGYGVYPGGPAPGGYGGGYPPQAAMYGGGGYGGGGGYPADPYAAAAAQYGGGGGYPGGGEAAGAGPAAAAPAAGGAWQEYKDDQGRAYYYNATTGVTQWEKPADF
jgi:far upstream element-binding protein